MAEKYINLKHLKFLLHDVYSIANLQQYDYYKDYDQEAIDMTLDMAKQIGDTYLFPFYTEMDKNKAYFKEGKVTVHESLKPAIQAIAEGGWISAHESYENGGQQMPLALMNAGLFVFYAANANAAAYAFLTQGAANLIKTFASKALIDAYVPKMYNGQWQGTMALTEPQAGSSLSDITSAAELTEEGHYAIKGQKIYISGGDHEAVDNVVHLMLARIKGAPVGTKGISLFVVPKYREENGEFVSNDVTTAGLFGKMGQKGYVAAHLIMGESDNCRGYLVGKEHHGLSYMFQMMNEARISTGMMAAATASAAYYAALQYAHERPQGRHPSNKDPQQAQVLIIEHADVKRMLLFQKSIVEGSASLLIQCSLYADQLNVASGETKEQAYLMLELLTPIAKSFPSEFGTHAVSMGMQCLGGAGYCDDFPLEQYYRDIRVNSIYEGTTAIHGMDLLGRKIMLQKGAAFKLFVQAIQADLKTAQAYDEVKPYADQLGQRLKGLHELTMIQVQVAMNNKPEVFLADASLYLEYFGIVTIAWQWVKMANKAAEILAKDPTSKEAAFYQGKIATMQYYMAYELPKTLGLHERLLSDDKLTLKLDPTYLD